MRRSVRRACVSVMLAGILAVAWAAPATATIHDIVASFCSGGNGELNPPGQSKFGAQSFLRALQASGALTLLWGQRPDGTADASAVTFAIDFSRPQVKFSPTGGHFSFTEGGLTVFIPNAVLDHPAFSSCRNLNP